MRDEFNKNTLQLSSKFMKQKEYWREKLSGDIEQTNIGFSCKKSFTSKDDDGKKSRVKILLPDHLSTRLMKLSKKSDLSLYIILTAGLTSLIYRYTGDEDIIVVSPLHRLKITGDTINSQVFIRIQVHGELTFKQLILNIKKTLLEAYENQDYPFDRLMEELFEPSVPVHRSISNIACALRNIHDDENIKILNSDISFIFSRINQEDKITGDIEYFLSGAQELYMHQMAEHFVNLLKSVIQDIEMKISSIPLLGKEEKKHLLVDFNNTWKGKPEPVTLHRVLEEQVDKTPDNIALCGTPCTDPLTYRELNERSNQLAHALRKKGVIPDTIVGLLVDRSIEMIVGILGILKSGGTYLPLEPEFPEARINYMLNDTSTRILLTQKKYIDKTRGELEVMDLENDNIYEENIENPGTVNIAGDLAYIIFTSGTTGKPKGVLTTHDNVMRVVKNPNYLDIRQEDRLLQLSNYAFDGSVFDIYGALLNGAALVLIHREQVLAVDQLAELVKRERITVFFVTTALFNALVDMKLDCFARIRKILFGGEQVSKEHSGRALDYLGKDRIIHVYGPTETTVYATYYPIDQIDETAGTIPIGRPISHTRVYILDKHLNPVPVRISGEIHIGGTGTSRGYLNSPRLTREKFINNPYIKRDWLYKTGDLARWLPKGEIEFLGRVDHQVKIRGFRIELAEIESQLQKHNRVKEAVVIVTSSGKGASQDSPPGTTDSTGEALAGDKHLCAYITLTNPEPLSVSQLREYLALELPDYMIPSYFVIVEAFTLTPNGKINRNDLPVPQEAALKSTGEYVAPRNSNEIKLVEIFNHVLERNITSITDNFFEIGGDSIKAIQIASCILQAGYKIEVVDILRYPVISELAQQIKAVEKTLVQDAVSGTIPLTPNQEAFFARWNSGRESEPHHYNQAMLLFSKEEPDEEAVKAIFTKVLEHHDVLRMIYQNRDGQILQTNLDIEHPLCLQVYDFRNQENALNSMRVRNNEIRASINLESGPLMKLGLFHLDDGQRLLIVIHQLVIDEVSWRILLEDLENLYQQYKKGHQLELPLKTDSFKSWSEKLLEYSNSKEFLKEKIYWEQLDSQIVPPIKKDFPKGDGYIKDTENLSFCLSDKETGLLLEKANHAFGTEINDILLTALGLAIKETFGNNQVLLALENCEREEIFKDLDISRTVGWFSIIYPILLDFADENDLSGQIIETKERLHQVPNKGIGWGILKYITQEKNKKEMEFKPEPQIRFKYVYPKSSRPDAAHRLFETAKEKVDNILSPKEQREYELDVSAMIDNNQLKLSLSYSKYQYKSETMQRLSNQYETLLKYFISYCSARDTKVLTPSDLTYKKISTADLEQLKKQYPVEDIYPLTPLQEGMFFHTLFDTDEATDFVQFSYRLKGELDLVLVEKSLNELFKRHHILRTAFVYKGFDRPLQVVLKDRQVDFYKEDIRGMDGQPEKERYIKEFIENDRRNSFDLSQDVLMRVAVIRENDNSYEFTWSFHHILMDGWCMGILIEEFFEYYNSFMANRPVRLAPVNPYRIYIEWLESRDEKESQRYWEKYLEFYDKEAGIPKMKVSKPDETSYLNELVIFELDRRKTKALNELAGRNQVTLNTVFQVVWAIILGYYCDKGNSRGTRDTDVVFGTVVSGHPAELPGVESMVGLFINTIPVRIRCQEKTIFRQLLKRVQEDVLASETHHYYPLAKIQTASTLKRNLLDHILVFENYSILEQMDRLVGLADGDNRYRELRISNTQSFGQTNYDLNVWVGPREEISVMLNYNGNVYQKEMIEQIAKHLEKIIDQIINDEELKIEDITLLSEEEEKQILFDFNNTGSDYYRDKSLHQLFEEQVERTPDHVALIGQSAGRRAQSKDEKCSVLCTRCCAITYRQLNEKANQLAHCLRRRGVEPSAAVGIMIESSVEMIIGLLGILKAGGAYLPIDPGCPDDRIKYVLADSGASILLTTQDIPKETIHPAPPVPFFPSQSTNLVYVIYTSGTTGKPKGVLVEHRGMVNYINWRLQSYHYTQTDVTLQLLSFAFDGFGSNSYSSLLSGGKLIMIPNDMRMEFQSIKHTIQYFGVTNTSLVPGMYRPIIESVEKEELRTLRFVVLAGQQAGGHLIAKSKEKHPELLLINEYGPTETTVTAAANIGMDEVNRIVIGRPIFNTQIYILDKYDHPQPVGLPGELCISGDGIARGYLNNPELTAEKFIDKALSSLLLAHSRTERAKKALREHHQAGAFRETRRARSQELRAKFYKTGDLARWMPDGTIEISGRLDFQVKIRGFRVETGEIENQLLKHKHIKEAVVIARQSSPRNTDKDEKGDCCLCAYIVPSPPGTAGMELKEELREYLSRSLPDYMIPTYFIQMEKIPLTSSGKINHKLLTEAKIEESDLYQDTYQPPRNEIEKKLVEIWGDILGIDKNIISIDASFFRLGGHSLKAISLVSRIFKEFNINVPLVELFRKPYIRQLVEYLETRSRGTFSLNDNNLVLLKQGPQKAGHLFFLHDGTGEVEGYIKFCNCLNIGFNCWGICADRLENYAPLKISPQDIAAKYIQKIKKIQPTGHGPYFIAGWSLGGIIAFEMVNQLEQEKEEVAFLALFDSPPPHQALKKDDHQLNPFNLESELKYVEYFFLNEKDDKFKEKLGNIDRIEHFWPAIIDYLESGDIKVELFKEKIKEYGMQALPNYHQLNLPEFIYYLNVGRSFANAMQSYIPEARINAPLHYFAARQSKKRVKGKQWEKYTASPIKYYEIEGDHHSIFRSPHVVGFARKFNQVMRKMKQVYSVTRSFPG